MRHSSILLMLMLLAAPAAWAGGAACVMAKFQGRTLDYELAITDGHVSEALEEAEERLRKKGYADYYKHLDIIRAQNLTNLPHAYVVVIRSDFRDRRGKERSVVGCGFSARSWDDALWDALRDAQSYFWGWKPDRDGYRVIRKVRY
ncbi:MAG TPA: hypothetical protein ENJ94_10015 [Gammaproteobacteria bacterium]|nr:hypothetical protein [Gammaproteobacteria bacterium]